MRDCWCGNADLTPFGVDYCLCEKCETLVSLAEVTPDQLLVTDDENDFYGKKYWLNHQRDDLGFDDIFTRSRKDLSERNLHWLEIFQKYCLPPAKVLELGCSHGSFVALLHQAGYDAKGVELSPWVVRFGQKIFDVPILVGPVEELDFPDVCLDAIVLMDVLEHLSDPSKVLLHCLKLLKPEGVLFIQTPNYKESKTYNDLIATNAPFLGMLQPNEHIYLFSKSSVIKLFQGLGANYVEFEPAIFARYDMCFIVSRQPLKMKKHDEIEESLLSTPQSRFVLAMLDIRKREMVLTARIDVSESDRAARMEQIETLTMELHESESDRAARLEQIETLTMELHESENDRAARMEQIETLTMELHESESDRAARLEQIETLTKQLQGSESSHEN